MLRAIRAHLLRRQYSTNSQPFAIRMIETQYLGTKEYDTVFAQMREFTEKRNPQTPDQIWLVEHPPVFTLGLSAYPNHIINANNIPIIKTDRGGEVTYHGPGQAVVYVLLDLKRKAKQNPIFAKELVKRLEQAIINTLEESGIYGERIKGAPGIYISPQQGTPELIGAKIAAIGLKITRAGMTYHGFALNVAMDLQPFSYINPCGYENLKVVDMKTLGVNKNVREMHDILAAQVKKQLE